MAMTGMTAKSTGLVVSMTQSQTSRGTRRIIPSLGWQADTMQFEETAEMGSVAGEISCFPAACHFGKG